MAQPSRETLQDEVDRNYRAFRELLPKLIEEQRGQFVLWRHEEPQGAYDTLVHALSEGRRKFSDNLFSIQEVTEEVADLGYFSNALHNENV